MTRVTFKDMIWFLMFNLLCISMQIALITSDDSTNNEINLQHHYSNNKSNIQSEFNDLFSDDTKQRSLRHNKDEDDMVSEEPMRLVEGSISNFMNEHHHQHSLLPSSSPSPDSSTNIIDDHNDHTEDDNQNQIIPIKTPTTCIVMPQEIDHCKHCEHPKYNSGVFKYNPSNHYCDIKYEMINEIITCPQGWEELVNYRNMKRYAEHYFKCTSQKVCCLYN